MTHEEKLVKIFRALGHPNRFKLFAAIVRAPSSALKDDHSCFVHSIMSRLKIGAPTVSHHLKELVNADLVSTSRDGKFLTCKVNQRALKLARAFFDINEGESST